MIVIVLLVLFPALFRILFAAQDEVSYGAGTGISTCDGIYLNDDSDLSRCTSTYDITIGNTGTNHQELIVIELGKIPKTSRLNWSALDIVATNRKPTGPRVVEQKIDDQLRIEIHDLDPNRLVQINLSSRGIESARQMEGVTMTIQAEGSVISANPRLTVVLRFLRNVTSIFGF